MESPASLLKFVSALVWVLLGLFLAATSTGHLLSGVYDVVPREKLMIFAHLCFGLLLIVSAGHYLASARPTAWIVALASLSSAGFFAWMCAGFIDWHFDPIEQGRNGGVLGFAAALAVMGLFGLLPARTLFAPMSSRGDS